MRTARCAQRGGFTLVEVMIAVAIIGLLASIAVPSYVKFQLRAKTAEVKSNLQAIRHAQMAYVGESGRFVAAPPSPPVWSGSTPTEFVDTGPAGSNFDTIGWVPEGRVYFSYAIAVDANATAFTADAAGDLDTDGTPQVWGIVHPDVAGATVAGPHGCTGVYDPGSGIVDRHSTVGPCSVVAGQSVF